MAARRGAASAGSPGRGGRGEAASAAAPNAAERREEVERQREERGRVSPAPPRAWFAGTGADAIGTRQHAGRLGELGAAWNSPSALMTWPALALGLRLLHLAPLEFLGQSTFFTSTPHLDPPRARVLVDDARELLVILSREASRPSSSPAPARSQGGLAIWEVAKSSSPPRSPRGRRRSRERRSPRPFTAHCPW